MTAMWARLPALCRSVLLVCIAVQLAGCATGRLAPDQQQRIAGKTYVITGASSGFGKGVALRLAEHGANVVLAARRTALLDELATQVRAAGGAPLVVTTDVSRPDDIERLASHAQQRFGRIDVWINNAGVGAIGRFDEIPLADHARVIDVNLKGVIYGSHVALRRFRQQGYGTLINIGSVESQLPTAYHASYAASKAAVLSLGRSLNEELRLAGLHAVAVSTVLPYAADTPFFENAANYSGGTLRMVAMDDPWKVVDAIVWASLYPREEVPAGWKAWGAYLGHNLFPDLSERVAADIMHRVQMENAPPAPPTSGNLHAPLPTGTTVEGGVRARMQREDAAK